MFLEIFSIFFQFLHTGTMWVIKVKYIHLILCLYSASVTFSCSDLIFSLEWSHKNGSYERLGCTL